MRTTIACLLALACLATPAFAQTRTAKPLEIYVVDVEGGNATLFVTPSGESLLIDTGNGGAAAVRDAGRIVEAAKDAGVTQIDHLIITHWHGDHFGGLAELAKQIPIKQFIDHGANVQPAPGRRRFPARTSTRRYRQSRPHGGQARRQARGRRTSTGASWRPPAGPQDAVAGARASPILTARRRSAGRRPRPRTRSRSAATSPSGSSASSTWAISPRTRNSS